MECKKRSLSPSYQYVSVSQYLWKRYWISDVNLCLFFSLAPIACSAGWLFYGTSCYKFSSLRKKWIDAKKDCRASGGYLLKIDDDDEQHFITYQQSKGYKVSHYISFCHFYFSIWRSLLWPCDCQWRVVTIKRINFHYAWDLKIHSKFCELLHVGTSICEQVVNGVTEV